MGRFLVLGITFVLSWSSVSYAQEVLFPVHPQINEKVSQFTESFILAMLPEFEQGSFKYDLARSDFARGELYARFDGVTSKTEIDNFSIPMIIGADIAFRVSNENEKEYGLNIDLNGQVSETITVIEFLENVLKPKCVENSAMAGKNQEEIEAICNAFDSKISAGNTSATQKFKILIDEWKRQIILLIENRAHKLQGNAAEVLTKYINEQIQVSEVPQGLLVNINISELGADLEKENAELVKNLKLNIIRINRLQALVTDNVIEYDISLTKLHSKRTIDKGMEFGQGFQNTIEDSTAGKKLGNGVREHIRGNNINSMFNLFMGANKLEGAKAAGKIAAEKTGNAISSILQNLGIGGGSEPETNKNSTSGQTSDEEELGL